MHVEGAGLVPGSAEIFPGVPSGHAPHVAFRPVRAGTITFEAGYRLSRRAIDEIIVAYFDSGTFHMRIGDVDEDVHAGQFMIADLSRQHEFSSPERSRDVYLHCTGPMARHYCTGIVERCGNVLSLDDPAPAVDALHRIYETLRDGEPIPDVRMSWYIDTLFTELATRARPRHAYGRDSGGSAVASGAGASQEGIAKVRAYALRHPEAALDLASMAAMANMSKFHFAKSFKAVTGITPHRYVLGVRMERAKYLLCYTCEQVGAVGRACGFGQTSNFCVAFKGWTGMTPGEFRASVTGGGDGVLIDSGLRDGTVAA